MISRSILTTLLLLTGSAPAATGLWQAAELPAIEDQLRAAGIAVDPKELADLQRYPMNAVVALGGECTATLVSPLGLMLTSHHCARATIESSSTADRNLLADGFVARTLGEELPAEPGLAVLLTVSAQDVTAQVLTKSEANSTGGESAEALERKSRRLQAGCEAAPEIRCRVYPMQAGARFILVKQVEIRDVRLAYAPPAAIADFGGSVDDRIWPRHAGDFALLRAYVGPDGRPADFSELNVPLRSAAHLKLQAAGLQIGEFAMAISYPAARAARAPPDSGGRGSLQVGFGAVRGEATGDGDAGSAFTDLAGLAASHTGTPPYAADARLLATLGAGKFEPYAVAGSIPVNFLADFDVADGSSGSPVLNARAELVGVVFAGNRAASGPGRLSDPARARSIAVDIRYMLWVMDAVDDADRLLQEIGVKPALADAAL